MTSILRPENLRFLHLDDIPTPYRVTVFNKFQQVFPGHLKVLYAAEKEKGRSWELPEHRYDYEILPGFSWKPPFQSSPFSFKCNPSVISVLRKWKPDVVAISGYAHPTMLSAMIWANLSKVTYGVGCESSLLSLRTRATFRLKDTILGWLLRDAGFGLATGSKARDYLASFGLEAKKVFFFPNSPCTEFVSEKTREFMEDAAYVRALKKRYALSDDFVLFVGRMILVKRPSDLINAWVQLPSQLQENNELVLVGSGPLSAEVSRLAQARSIKRVKFLGDVPYEDVLRIMSLAKVLVLPSSYEPWGAVVNESMSVGTPAICSDAVGAAYDMIRTGETGWLYPAGDVSRLAAAIEGILCLSEGEYGEMKKKCRELAGHWGGEAAAANLLRAVMTARV